MAQKQAATVAVTSNRCTAEKVVFLKVVKIVAQKGYLLVVMKVVVLCRVLRAAAAAEGGRMLYHGRGNTCHKLAENTTTTTNCKI